MGVQSKVATITNKSLKRGLCHER